jgi:hypothetical protein
MGAANAHYLGIKVFSETDFTDDLKAIDVPTLVMQGDDGIGMVYGGYPARAGMVPPQTQTKYSLSGFPRPRGDGSFTAVALSSTQAVSPPARGWSLIPAIASGRRAFASAVLSKCGGVSCGGDLRLQRRI